MAPRDLGTERDTRCGRCEGTPGAQPEECGTSPLQALTSAADNADVLYAACAARLRRSWRFPYVEAYRGALRGFEEHAAAALRKARAEKGTGWTRPG